MRIDLNCPFHDKDKAKSLGAKWDMARKTWFIVDMEDLTPFMRWIPSHRANPGKQPAPAAATCGITLKEYMAMHYKGSAKALTASAARAFGVPYPLESGWHKKYANNLISMDRMHAIQKKVGKKAASRAESAKQSPTHAHSSCEAGTSRNDGRFWARTGPSVLVSCGCDVLPWDDCEHTEAAAHNAMRDMLEVA